MTSTLISFTLLGSLLAFVSCSQKGTNVRLEISHFGYAASPELSTVGGGGIMVWGKGNDGSAFAQFLDNANSINLDLRNGTWTFYAMAWDGSKDFSPTPVAATNHIFGGVVRCAKSAPVTLGGAKANVDLSLNNSTCADADFKGTASTTTDGSGNLVLPKTEFHFCRNLGLITDGAKVCMDGRLDTRVGEKKAWIGSFKVHMRPYIKDKDGARVFASTTLSSPCTEMEGDPVGTSPDANEMFGASLKKVTGLPAGGPGLPFHVEIEMFPGNSKCDDPLASPAVGIRGSLWKIFPNGIATTPDNNSHKYFAVGSVHKQYLKVTSESICTGRNGTSLGTHPFAAGEGTLKHPYIICSVPQFHSINNAQSNLSLHYKLESDLDFNPYSQGLPGSGVVPTVFACLKEGSNFLPIGYYGATCAAPGTPMAYGTYENFTGSFNGGGYKISNLRFKDDKKDNLGMFVSINGTAKVGNFTLEKTEIEGKSAVGGVSAMLQGATDSTSVLIWSITGKNLDIQARDDSVASYVGSMFGNFDKGTMYKIHVKDSKVRGEGSYTGGIVGNISNSNVTQSGGEIDIEADSGQMGKTCIGGLAGRTTTTTLDFVKHEGGIYSNATKMGGLIGCVDSSTTVTNFYTISHIFTNDFMGTSIGGVFGDWNSSGNVGPGYTLSTIKTFCPTGCTQGKIAGTQTTSPSVEGTMLVLPSNAETGANGGAAFTGENNLSTGIGDIRTLANTADLVDTTNNDWKKMAGEYPRFDFENHPCTVTGYSGSGAGTATSPIVICNEGQYSAIGSSSAYFKLAANIRISNSNPAVNEFSVFNANLEGNNKSIIGGNSVSGSGSSEGHIAVNNGVIKNIKYQGMSRFTSSGGSASTPHGTIVATNNGTLENISARIYPSYLDYAGGLVGKNASSGIIRNVYLDVRMQGQNYQAPIAYKNAGLIEKVRLEGEFECRSGPCSTNTGMVVVNSNTLKESSSSFRYRDGNSSPDYSSYVSMIADSNSGTIQDVSVDRHAEFNVKGSNTSYFVGTNTGTLTRVVNNGRLLFGLLNFSDTMTGFPSSNGTGGTFTEVFRSGGRSGKLLIDNKPFTCNDGTNNNRLAITATDWTIPDSTAWNTFLESSYNSLAVGAKKLVAEYDYNNGTRFRYQVMNFANASTIRELTIPVNGDCPSTAINGKVSVYWTDDIPTDGFGAAISAEVILPPYEGLKASYGATWSGMIWDRNNAGDMNQIFAYYAYLLGVTQTPPSVVKKWVMEEEGLSLFEMD